MSEKMFPTAQLICVYDNHESKVSAVGTVDVRRERYALPPQTEITTYHVKGITRVWWSDSLSVAFVDQRMDGMVVGYLPKEHPWRTLKFPRITLVEGLGDSAEIVLAAVKKAKEFVSELEVDLPRHVVDVPEKNGAAKDEPKPVEGQAEAEPPASDQPTDGEMAEHDLAVAVLETPPDEKPEDKVKAQAKPKRKGKKK